MERFFSSHALLKCVGGGGNMQPVPVSMQGEDDCQGP